jgi:predicted MPP superfamily phosphohydrolase
VLYHYPDLIDRLASKQVDLLLAGHTHGGQIALPFFGAIVTLSKGWKRYERGLYRVGESYLYVNRGLGTDLPAIRFFARPEIAVIDLIPPRPDGFHPSEDGERRDG